MVLSILDPTLVLIEVILRKIREERDLRQQQRTLESEVRVGLDTEIDTVVDSDNEPTPKLRHIEVEIESKTSSSNTVNLKLSGSTVKKKMKKRNNKDDPRESSKTLSELWPKSNKYYEKINTEIKESNSASLSKNILIDFKAKKFPFILSINVFQEFLSDLESTVGNKLNLRDFNFSYRYPVLGKDCDITINSQVTFTAFIKYILSDNPDLILIKITQVNSQPLLLLKKDELSPPKSDDETMQPQSQSPLENQLDFKNASGKEILKYLDQFEWKLEYLKKFEKFKPAKERAVREIVGKLETKYCEKCPGRHMVQIFRDMVDDETKMKFQSLFTEVDYNLFKKKRKMVMDVYGNSLVDKPPLCAVSIML